MRSLRIVFYLSFDWIVGGQHSRSYAAIVNQPMARPQLISCLCSVSLTKSRRPFIVGMPQETGRRVLQVRRRHRQVVISYGYTVDR